MENTELTPALERVAASVVETTRRRKQLEDELAAASAAVASLQHQSTSLESSIAELRDELEDALVARAHEDAALEQLSTERSKVIDLSDALRTEIEVALAEKSDTQTQLQGLIQAARKSLAGVESDIRDIKARTGKITADAAGVHETVTAVRQSVEAAQTALAEVSSKTRELDTATDDMAARVCRIAESIDHVERSNKQIAGASDGLTKLSAKLEARKADAESAAQALLALSKDRQESAAKIAEQLAKLEELCAAEASAANGTPKARPSSSSPEPASQSEKPAEPAPQSAEPVQPPQPAKTATSTHYEETLATLQLLAGQGLIANLEATSASELLQEGGVDKLVRAWWSRAMAGPAPGYYRLVIGEALAEAGDAKGALTFFNRAMEGKPVDPFITYLVARALLRMKRYVDVLRIAQALGRSKHGKTLALNIEALHQSGGRHFDEAEAKLTQALATPGLAKLHYNETLYNLATVAAEKGDARAAAAWYEKLYSLDPAYRGIANHIEQRGVPVGAG